MIKVLNNINKNIKKNKNKTGFKIIELFFSPEAHKIINSLSVLILFKLIKTDKNEDMGIVRLVTLGNSINI
tara:strand:- start:420 stop:632 length:213 start_codon:yes stop_codon:yes gene_type:complete